MLQAQRKKSYRISENRRRLSHFEESRGIRLHIDSPVLEQYRSIDLGATLRSHRIKHKSISTNASGASQNQNKFKTKWEVIVDRYVQSKQKIQQRKGHANSSFQFLKLDRTNRFRYIRLATNEALPLDLSRICKMTEQVSLERQKGHHRLKTDYHISSLTQQSAIVKKRVIQHRIFQQVKDPNEKLLDHFVQSYFKSKYKKDSRDHSITQKTKQQNSSYFVRSLLRSHTD